MRVKRFDNGKSIIIGLTSNSRTRRGNDAIFEIARENKFAADRILRR